MSPRRPIHVLLLILLTLPAHGREARLPRHPAPSPDGDVIAFSWQGDIWTVPAEGGAARRLTVHPAADRRPVWSRDGKLIAFSSARHGNGDIFVMPADGGRAPERLTFNSADDTPLDFTPDGAAVLFSSNRARVTRWMRGLYTVPVAGGTPRLAQAALGDVAAFDPAGERLAFVRGSSGWTRRDYRGSANYDIWLAEADGAFARITDFDGTDSFPIWRDDRTLLFLSDREGDKNLFTLDLPTGRATRVTRHAGSDIRFPRGSADGALVAYEFEDGIYVLGAGDAEPRRLSIDVPADGHRNPVERRIDTRGAKQLTVNPDETLAAYIVHGDIFITEIASAEDQKLATPVTRRLTDTPERERDPCWSPDGERLLFSSDRDGYGDLFTLEPAGDDADWLACPDYRLRPVRAETADEYGGRYAPTGDRIAYLRGRGDLVVCDADGGHPRVLFEHWSHVDFDWSPDGRWLTYSRNDIDYSENVWIISADGGVPYNVSRHPDDDSAPHWSPDGRRIVWSSRRHEDTADIWGVWLTRADHERSVAQWHRYRQSEKEKPAPATEPEPPADGGEAFVNGHDGPPEVAIDFDGLWERARPITRLAGDESQPRVSPDGERVLFTAEVDGERDLHIARWDGEELKRLTHGGRKPEAVAFSADGETIYHLTGEGVIKRISPDGREGDPIPFRARHDLDLAADRGAAFDEAWRALNARFYDPDFHGVDWAAQREKYRPWALAATCDEDFREIVRCMLGELNASHMNYYPPRREDEGDGDATGALGATCDPAAGGPGLLIAAVVPGSPAARADVGLAAGDRILAIEGREITPTTNLHDPLNNTVGRPVALTVRKRNGDERRVTVEPIGARDLRDLDYRQWVRERRDLVDALSGGRLGYLHIRSMSLPAFEDFESSLYNAGHGKEAMIIDVRSNGGGWTTDYLFTVLSIRRHAYTMPRGYEGTERGYPQSRLPLAAWTRPALTLCNEESFSNAEIFAHAFRSLGRGPVVGVPTHGGVISTGSADLVNGGRVRLPGRGWYTADGGVNMEHNGCVPDHIVEQPPREDMSAAEDTQLRRAVEILLDGLADDPRSGDW